jgi:effector-binding domain-containing protein
LIRIHQIENRIGQLNEDGSLRDYDVVVQNIPEQRVLSVRRTIASFESGVKMMHDINHLLPMRAGREVLGNLIIVMHANEYVTEDIDIEIGFQVKHELIEGIHLANGLQLTISTLPAIEQAATVVREGLFIDHLSCYGSLGKWIENNRYQIAGNGREIVMQPIVRGNEDHILVELQIPIALADAQTRPY